MIPFGLASLMTVSLPIGRRATKCLVPGASAIYLFNEGSGTTLRDYSGNGYDCRLGTTTGADDADPAWGATGLTFDGSDDIVQYPTAAIPAIDAATAYTLIAVAKATGAGSAQSLVSKKYRTSATGGAGFDIDLVDAGPLNVRLRHNLADGEQTQVTAKCFPDIPLIDTWRMYSGVWSGTEIRVGVDSVFSDPVAATTFTPSPTQYLTFGRLAYSTSGYFTGELAAVVIYPTGLTTAQIAQNYAALKGILAPRGVTLA